MLDYETAATMVSRANWYHAYELMPGLVTPGILPIVPSESLDCFEVAADLSGIDALEIGTLDGPIAFELEKRGARVTTLDIQDPSRTGFDTARAILGSSVRYVRGGVNDIPELLSSQQFDLIVFFGVFYHLKNPVLAFERIAGALRDDRARLLIEGECLLNYVEDISGQPIPAPPLDFLCSEDVALTLFYPGKYKGDDSNWHVPNLACVRAWLSAAGLDLEKHMLLSRQETSPPLQRMGGIVRRVGVPPVEHPCR